MAFPDTRWSVIQRAKGALDDEAAAAFDELCGAYWYPLFAYLRRGGTKPEEAADLVQELFVSLLERQSLDRLQPEGARFRSWLLAALRHHVQDARARERADKRGGGRAHFPLDLECAEGRYTGEPAEPRDPAALFERAWAVEVLARGSRVSYGLLDRATAAGELRSRELLAVPFVAKDTPAACGLCVPARAGVRWRQKAQW